MAKGYFLVRTITAEISAISTAPSKNSAAVSWERCSSLSPTFSTFPPIFSPDFIRSSTVCPTFFSRMLRIVSLGWRSILPWAERLEQAKARRQAMRREERFMVVLFCPRNGRMASENVATRLWRAGIGRPTAPWLQPRAEFKPLAGGAPALQFCMEPIGENLERVRAQIAEAAKKSGRSMDEIELVAISKTHEAEKVRAAFDAGQQLFGESRVQEARAKIPLLPSAARWHFVGRLQKNKVRHALPLFELFHSVDSLERARDMNRIADEEGLHPRILLEVNVAGEGSKIGFAPDVLRTEMEALLELPRLTIEGLMTIPPLAREPEASRQYFVALRELRDALATEFQVKLPQLSMGMSGDFAVAIEEGATLVRVGTSIFGKRTPPRERARAAFDSGDWSI